MSSTNSTTTVLSIIECVIFFHTHAVKMLDVSFVVHLTMPWPILLGPLLTTFVATLFTWIDSTRLLVEIEVSDVLLHTTRSTSLLHLMVGFRLPLGIRGDLLDNSGCLVREAPSTVLPLGHVVGCTYLQVYFVEGPSRTPGHLPYFLQRLDRVSSLPHLGSRGRAGP